MKTLRQQILDRIATLGGEKPEFYDEYSDYDLLEDYESVLRNQIDYDNHVARSREQMEEDEQ